MPRPHKCRRVCALPQDAGFLPVDGEDKSPVCLCVDEYEAIRLMDLEGLTQEQCALQMEVSRSVGISQAQISRLEKSALRQIKSLM